MSGDDLELRAAALEKRAEALERISGAERRIGEVEAARTQPWWRQAKVVTGISAIISATVPVTTFVSGWIQKERELALNEQLQSHKIRWDYVKEALDPGRSEPQRALVFSLLELTGDDLLRDWAKSRRQETEKVIVDLQTHLADVTRERQFLVDQRERLQAQLVALGSAARPAEPALAMAKQEEGKLTSKLEAVAETQDNLRQRLGLVLLPTTPADRYHVVLSNDATCADAQAAITAVRGKLAAKLAGFDPALLQLYRGTYDGQAYYVTAYGGGLSETEARVIRAQLFAPEFRADVYVSSGRTFEPATDCPATGRP